MQKEFFKGKKNHKFIIDLYDSLLIFELYYYLYMNILFYKIINKKEKNNSCCICLF